MTLDEIKRILARGESKTVAVIEKEDEKKLLQTVCAMANTQGGHIVVGARERLQPVAYNDRFRIDGIPHDRGAYDFVENAGATLNPKAKTEWEECKIGNDQIAFVVSVEKTTEIPTLLDGKAWIRLDEGNALADQSFIDSVKDLRLPKEPEINKLGSNLSREEEYRTIIEAILRVQGFGIDVSTLEQETGIAKDRIEGHAERLERIGLLKKLGRTSSGAYIEVTSGNRLSLEEELDKLEVSLESVSRVSSEPARKNETGPNRNNQTDESNEGSSSRRFGLKKLAVGTKTDYRRNSREEESCLNANSYAVALAAFFENAGEDLCFGLFGHWGRGKTYLMNKVCSLLEERQYRIVKFSAWKYRSTPETWAYLFSQFMETGRKDDWRLPVTAGFVHHGVAPLIFAMYAFAISLYLSRALGDLAWLLMTVGAASLIFVFFTSLKFLRFGRSVHAKYMFNGHEEELGLQATIGQDLTALVSAWIPEGSFAYWKSFGFWGKATLYVVGCFLVLLLIWNSFETPNYMPASTGFDAIEKLRLPVNPWAVFAIFAPCLVCSIVGPAVLFWPWRQHQTKRILLVIDDLDRCENDQMLEIIESTMLLLDDEQIKSRVQIGMLVEERAVRSALARKYCHLWADLPEDLQLETKEQILRENIEKIFLAHLRLPELRDVELKEVFQRFMEIDESQIESGDVAESTDSTSQLESVASNESLKDAESQDADADSTQRFVTKIERDLTWSEDELYIFSKAVADLRSSTYEGRWGGLPPFCVPAVMRVRVG